MPRGWLLLLCAFLLVLQPLSFAVEAASTLPTLGMRGVAGTLELLAHGAVAAVSFAAGWALWQASPAGPILANVALAAGGVAGVQSLYWSILPNYVHPSDRLPLAALTLAHAGAWLVYLRRSKRIRAIEG
jgi:hypothetical protein